MSVSITIIGNLLPPTVSFISPTENSTVTNPVTIILSTTDEDGILIGANFFVSGNEFSVKSSPWQLKLNLSVGYTELTAMIIANNLLESNTTVHFYVVDSTNSNSNSNNNNNNEVGSSTNKIPVGLIVGVILGGLALIVLVIIGVWLITKYKKKGTESNDV